ncbi:MAG: hypothetical protein COA80_08605 [Leeuwenhoekiella sp.]|nr:MAG: hypothetical protein COA80_08605 [Leeuwenhoekiella sp.]
MSNHYNHDSFEKGEAFENFVEAILFPAHSYDLLHKTNAYSQNQERYVGDSRLPDFRFRDRITGREFHIEAKFRSNPYKDQYELLSYNQCAVFDDLHTATVPIFIVLGFGGTAQHPAYVSLIPFIQPPERYIDVSDAYSFQIPHKTVDSSFLEHYAPTAKEPAPAHQRSELKPVATAESTSSPKPAETNSPQETTTARADAKPALRKKSVFKLGVAAAALVIIVISAIWRFGSPSPEPESILEQRIATYYQLSDANNLKELVDYFSPELDYWYGIKNPTPQEVIDNIKAYRKQYPYSETTVDWDRFSITPQNNGEFYATYPLEYKVRSKETGPWRTYDLKLITVWDNAYRLVSIQEVK